MTRVREEWIVEVEIPVEVRGGAVDNGCFDCVRLRLSALRMTSDK